MPDQLGNMMAHLQLKRFQDVGFIDGFSVKSAKTINYFKGKWRKRWPPYPHRLPSQPVTLASRNIQESVGFTDMACLIPSQGVVSCYKPYEG